MSKISKNKNSKSSIINIMLLKMKNLKRNLIGSNLKGNINRKTNKKIFMKVMKRNTELLKASILLESTLLMTMDSFMKLQVEREKKTNSEEVEGEDIEVVEEVTEVVEVTVEVKVEVKEDLEVEEGMVEVEAEVEGEEEDKIQKDSLKEHKVDSTEEEAKSDNKKLKHSQLRKITMSDRN